MTAGADTSQVEHAPRDTDDDLRVDSHTGARTFVVASRQERPNLPVATCPFCPGGLEAPEDYDVRWFENRWPAMPGGRCEIILYTPQHDATLWSLGTAGVRKVVDLWAERTGALGARADVEYVLVFENRGAEVGATIPHPHGQIYAFGFVPDVPLAELTTSRAVLEPAASAAAEGRLVATAGGWRAWVPRAPIFPYAVLLAPERPVPDLPSLDAVGRDDLAALLVDVLHRFDALFMMPIPYMLWIHQRPFDGRDWPSAVVHAEIVSPWRAAGVPRYVAAGELGSGVFFNPVAPEDAARGLRDAASARA